MINQPWIPFPDFEDHVAISPPLINVMPEIEVHRANFAKKLALSTLLAMGDSDTAEIDRHRMAVYLAGLSARVIYRRRILASLLDAPPKTLPEAVKESLEQLEEAVHNYWLVAQIANVLALMPAYKSVLGWSINQFVTASAAVQGEHVTPPWRSARLGEAMSKKYKAREAFLVKLWDARFPIWMRRSGRLTEPKNPGFQA